MVNKYDYKKSIMKFIKVAIPVIAAGVASVYGNSEWYLAIAPAVAMISNIAKHKYGLDMKIV